MMNGIDKQIDVIEIDAQKDRQIKLNINRQIDIQINRFTERQMLYILMHRRIDRSNYILIDRQIYR